MQTVTSSITGSKGTARPIVAGKLFLFIARALVLVFVCLFVYMKGSIAMQHLVTDYKNENSELIVSGSSGLLAQPVEQW